MGGAFLSLRANPLSPSPARDPPDSLSLPSRCCSTSSSSSPPPLTPFSSSKFHPKQPQISPIRPLLRVSHCWTQFWVEFRAHLARLRRLWATNRGPNVYPRYGHVIQLLVVSILYKLQLEFVLQTPNSNLLQYV